RDAWAEVARGAELAPDPRVAHTLGIVSELRVDAGRRRDAQRLVDHLGREQPGLHRRVRALDLRAVQESRLAADEHAARHDELRQRLQAALADRARAVRDPLAAREHAANAGVRLTALELGERIEMWIPVAERDDEAEIHARLGRVIETSAALGRVVGRPAERVHDLARPVQLGIDLPDLLEAD